jgi:branched-chain amino acid transport system ATP-binding protein
LESSILRVNSLSKVFGKMKAVDHVTFDIQPGFVTSLIGPNGAGKTTLFNLITGHLRADTGEIVFKGIDITNWPPHKLNRKGLARSFQIVNIFPRLTVLENIQAAVISRIGKSSNITHCAKNVGREEAFQILERMGLSGKVDYIAGTLSYGDQRIMEIAIALGSKPELLLLDEPTAGMAPEETYATARLIKGLVSDFGLTILIVEHDMDVVFSISETIVVLHEGKMLARGTPEEVRQNQSVQKVYLGEELSREKG